MGDSACTNLAEQILHLGAKARVVDIQGAGADEDELGDVLVPGIRWEVPADQAVALLRLRIGRDLALGGQIEEGGKRPDPENQRENPRTERDPRPARARSRDPLGRESRRRSYPVEACRLSTGIVVTAAPRKRAVETPKARWAGLRVEGISKGGVYVPSPKRAFVRRT